jgi:hypothetical protein
MRSLLNECVADLTREIDRFPWTERAAYADWLAQTFYYVRHSTRLLAAAAARFAFDERANALHHRFARHMGEEKKHELLALHDIKQLGASIGSLPERHSTRLFYEPQYYKLEHQAPIVLLGYILPLEAIAAAQGQHIIEQVVPAFGDTSVSFLRVHAEEDTDHLDKALRAVHGIPDDQRLLIEENMRQSTYAYGFMLRDIRAQLETRMAA